MAESTKFHIWHDGDSSVGIWGESATVEVYCYDAEFESMAREVLVKAFTDLWDFKARIVSELELAAEARDEAEADAAAREYERRLEVWRRRAGLAR